MSIKEVWDYETDPDANSLGKAVTEGMDFCIRERGDMNDALEHLTEYSDVDRHTKVVIMSGTPCVKVSFANKSVKVTPETSGLHCAPTN